MKESELRKKEQKRAKDRERKQLKRALETDQEIKARRSKRRLHESNESAEHRTLRLKKQREKKRESRAAESVVKRNRRLALEKEKYAQSRATESVDKRNRRLALERQRYALAIQNESEQEHQERLARLRDAYAQHSASAEAFNRAINTFCDRTCEICIKQCYPDQVTKFTIKTVKPYLPQELASKNALVVCHRCNTHPSKR